MIVAGGLRGGLYPVDFGVNLLPRDTGPESTEIPKLPYGIYATSMSFHLKKFAIYFYFNCILYSANV